jgi:hypothetical protein
MRLFTWFRRKVLHRETVQDYAADFMRMVEKYRES